MPHYQPQGSQEKIVGVGLGLRAQHYEAILETRPAVPWFEAISENYLGASALPMRHLEAIRENYPIVLHGVSLSIGSSDPLNQSYLQSLKALRDRIDATWISDHLCWSSLSNQYIPDLWPLPFEEKVIRHVVERVLQVQDYLQDRILLENISSYLQFTHSVLPEWEFINAVAAQADCYLLLDINNVYVNAINHHFDPRLYIDAMPTSRVKQLHLGGFEQKDTYLLDTHGHAVHEVVWELFDYAQSRLNNVPTCIEWDNDIPNFNTLLNEAKRAQQIMQCRGVYGVK